MRFIPPEAFTHRELAQALTWLGNQPDHIQKAVQNNKEALVSLFKKSMRNGNGELPTNLMSAPPSSDAFRSDLKSLAQGLRQFEEPASFKTELEPESREISSQPVVKKGQVELDEKSWALIQTVKLEFNLSHEFEALRMLITLGFDRASAIFPKSKLQN
ncbi:MAG: hypothetical protein SGJ18_06960 [Pseudomonadota bacterium]|nr:hypothetical protein [Pseudomonadota bacterium]